MGTSVCASQWVAPTNGILCAGRLEIRQRNPAYKATRDRERQGYVFETMGITRVHRIDQPEYLAIATMQLIDPSLQVLTIRSENSLDLLSPAASGFARQRNSVRTRSRLRDTDTVIVLPIIEPTATRTQA